MINVKTAPILKEKSQFPDRVGRPIQTYTGKWIYPLDPRPEEIDIEDIAQGLSNICRFTGQSNVFYSVSQHSVLVSIEASMRGATASDMRTLGLAGLLHDAAESYLGDLSTPVKNEMPTYVAAEFKLQESIFAKYYCPFPMHKVIKEIDKILLVTEMRDLMRSVRDWESLSTPLSYTIKPWSPTRAKKEFLSRFNKLTKE